MYFDEPTTKEKLILNLHSVKGIKFGEFKLKSGIISPYYFDLRSLVYYPSLLDLTADVFWKELQLLNFDVVVGVPYTGIPIASAIGLKHNRPMVIVRKEAKDYGTKKLIEGDYHTGQKAVIVDDVITNGESKIETITKLEEVGLTVEDIVVLIDREQGGIELIREKKYNCIAIFTLSQVFEILLLHKRISKEVVDSCMAFNKDSRNKLLESN
ncbi:MAG: orotate phosphoribosyltransferase [bacterium]|nr:orotate phosphoribosyltransferase [bacterium]